MKSAELKLISDYKHRGLYIYIYLDFWIFLGRDHQSIFVLCWFTLLFQHYRLDVVFG